jgi:hypothetical protein
MTKAVPCIPALAERGITRPDEESVTLDRLERGLALAAYLVVLDGPVLAPIFEKLERELEIMRGNQDAVGRAKLLLESYRVVGGVKAIA